MDIELQDKSYRVARIDHIEQYTGDGRARGGGYTKITVDAPQAWQLIDFLKTGRATIEKIEPHKEGEEE